MAFVDNPSLRSESQVVFPVIIGISRLFNPSLLAELAQNLGTGAGSFPEYCGRSSLSNLLWIFFPTVQMRRIGMGHRYIIEESAM